MDNFIALLNSSNAWVVVALCAFLIPISAIVLETIRKMSQTKQMETTRREVAAYVAEGSITPDDAAMILSAKPGADMRKLRRERA